MQNLLQLIVKHGVFLLFLFLEIFCLILIVNYNKSQNAIFVNSSNLFSGWALSKTDRIVKYINISEIADSLAMENARLRTALDKALYEPLIKGDTIVDSVYQQEYSFIPARVINNSVQLWDNKITLNRGSKHGIGKGMGIINDRGIVGIINNTTENYSQALSILHSQLRISATHQKSGRFGTLVWTDIDPYHILLKDVHMSANISVGDTIVTNRYSTVFPNNIMVGTIEEFEIERGTKIYRIVVKLNQNMSQLDYVYIIDYLNKEEQLEVEGTITDE